MKAEDITSDDEEIILKYTPFQRLLGHHLLDKDSFIHAPKLYMILTPIIILILIMALNVGNFAILVNKMQFIPSNYPDFAIFRESVYFGIFLTTVPQILLWAVIVHGLMVFLGGKGSFPKSLSIYSFSQIPVVIGLIILMIIALAQSTTQIYPYGFPLMGSYLLEYSTVRVSYDIYQIFNVTFSAYSLASNILIPVTNLYSSVIAGFGLSSEHKTPTLVGLFVTGLAFIASMIFYFII